MFQLVVLSLLLVQVGIVGGMQPAKSPRSTRSTVPPLGEDSKMEEFWNKVKWDINQTAKHSECGYSCYCDQLCMVFDDCCHWASTHYANTKAFSQRKISRDTFTCEKIPEISEKTISFVNRCPLNYGDAGIRSECETTERNGLLNVPVSDPVTSILYRNVYCALCHNVTKYVYWLQKILCERNLSYLSSLQHVMPLQSRLPNASDITFMPPTALPTPTPSESFQSFKNNNLCLDRVEYFHPNFTYRICKPHIRSCIAGWGDGMYKDACTSHTNFITVGGHYYKNKYCALCNYEEANFMSPYCSCKCTPPVQSIRIRQPDYYSFAVIMDANSGGHYTERIGGGDIRKVGRNFPSAGKQCRPTEVYDHTNDMCRALRCIPPLQLDKGKCKPPGSGFNTSSMALACPLVVLNATEYESFENNSIWVHALKILLAVDQYQRNGSEVSICVAWSPQLAQVQMFKYDKIQAIISLIGQIISLTALALNFLTYMFFPSLRNLPGKCIMNLVFALFVAHLLFVVGIGQTGDHKVCMAVAMVMHYCFLASFFWMNGLAFELWRTFSKIEMRHKEKGTKKFLFYAFYGWVSPALIVAIGATGDVLYTHSQFVPGYGKGVCWLTNGSGLLLFFGLPLGILLLLNLLLYCLVIKALAITSRSSTLMRQNNNGNKRLFRIYVQLTTIMGFTWIFGFAATFADIPVLWYIFVVLNTLQGLFICLTFVCKRNVFKLFSEMCCKKATESRLTELKALQTSSPANPGLIAMRAVEQLERPKTKDMN